MAETEVHALALPVDRRDDVPVGVQLAWKLRAAIASGKLVETDRLPSVREVAELSGVNVNTARAVYARLEREGLIETRHGLGTFVAPSAGASPDIERIAAETVAWARELGLAPRDIARAIYAGEWAGAEPTRHPDPGPEFGRDADEAAARRELRRQIARLEAELASHPEARPEGEPPRPALRRKGHIAGLAELEATRDELMQRLKNARADADRRGKRESRARLRREDAIADPEHHRFERITRDECGDPGCGEVRVVPRFGPVGALAGWWRVRVSSGCPLAAPP